MTIKESIIEHKAYLNSAASEGLRAVQNGNYNQAELWLQVVLRETQILQMLEVSGSLTGEEGAKRAGVFSGLMPN